MGTICLRDLWYPQKVQKGDVMASGEQEATETTYKELKATTSHSFIGPSLQILYQEGLIFHGEDRHICFVTGTAWFHQPHATLMATQTAPLPLEGGILLNGVGDTENNVTIQRSSAVTTWACPGGTRMRRQRVCNWVIAFHTDYQPQWQRGYRRMLVHPRGRKNPSSWALVGTGKRWGWGHRSDLELSFSGPQASHGVSPQDKQRSRMNSLPLPEAKLSPHIHKFFSLVGTSERIFRIFRSVATCTSKFIWKEIMAWLFNSKTWLTNFCRHQNHLEGVLKHSIASIHPQSLWVPKSRLKSEDLQSMKFPDMKLLVQDHTWKKNVLTYPQVLLISISSHLYPGRTEAEAPILWPPDAKSQITGKDPGAGKDWGQEKGVREDEMVR